MSLFVIMKIEYLQLWDLQKSTCAFLQQEYDNIFRIIEQIKTGFMGAVGNQALSYLP